MSYQALYRVWRPQRFDELVGQQIVTQTLKNAIITHQISHAYLFAGPRGTGKTSAAKIFAKAVNCHHSEDGEPCNKCEICKAITNGQLNDVIEIDAASNNGVEEIRDIRDKAKYAPTQADYKVYIIDEVHMLSTGAFNALLKTLEEPPANVIFILATTEPHKIPLTIISRVQRFDFRRISAQDAFDRMKYILDQKKVDYEEKALWVIANAAEGGMRDALSILDQVLSFSDNQVKLDDALLVTGSVTKQLLKKYFLEVAQQQSAAALDTMQKILGEGKDGQRFIEDLIAFIRDVLLYQESPKLIVVASTGLKDEDFQELSKAVDATTLYQMIDELNDIQEEMRFTTHPDVYLEVLTVKLCQIRAPKQVSATSSAPQAPVAQGQAAQSNLAANQVIQQLQQEVQQLQQTVKNLAANPWAQNSAKPSKPRVQQRNVQVNLNQVYPVLGAATRKDLVNIQNLWGDMLNHLTVPQRSLLHVSKPVAASGSGVIVAFDYAFLFKEATTDENLTTAMEQALQSLMGTEHRVVFVPKNKWPQIRQTYIKEHGLDKRPARQKATVKPTSASAVPQAQPRQAESTALPNPTSAAAKTVTAPPQPTPAPSSAAPLPEEPPLPDEPPALEDDAAPQEGDDAGSQTTDPVAAAKQLFGDDIVKIEDN
ncbi:DNA polymerase III subunit gamma/tau [Limosilactobacillus kribbianus]|uniref:DNA polymerase III subunit gamma/tau n=1 Tax=Limosilactobacillus kribbianus TaxID=2982695 RepID=UPI002263ECAA